MTGREKTSVERCGRGLGEWRHWWWRHAWYSGDGWRYRRVRKQGVHQDEIITRVEGVGDSVDSVDISGRGDRKQWEWIQPDISPTWSLFQREPARWSRRWPRTASRWSSNRWTIKSGRHILMRNSLLFWLRFWGDNKYRHDKWVHKNGFTFQD